MWAVRSKRHRLHGVLAACLVKAIDWRESRRADHIWPAFSGVLHGEQLLEWLVFSTLTVTVAKLGKEKGAYRCRLVPPRLALIYRVDHPPMPQVPKVDIP